MARETETPKQGAPLWMVSFGDMMTLILTFFILLVSMAAEQQQGLLAKGVGSFLIALQSHGMPGLMGEQENLMIFKDVRVRFNLPPEEDVERREDHLEASTKELLRAEIAEALTPHEELVQPAVAVFDRDSAVLSPEGERYLDRLAPTLRPQYGQLLVLEGHATDADREWGGDDRRLAFARARAVRAYLVETHDFLPQRVEPRIWLAELPEAEWGGRQVDARLITPRRPEPEQP